MKKTLSMLLAIIMVFSMLPLSTYAAGSDGQITFTTDFWDYDEVAVGDTFSVTAELSGNPGIASFSMGLEWDNRIVKFTGFKVDEEGYLDSKLFSRWEPVINHDTGYIVAFRTENIKTNGDIFTANFEVIAGGDPAISMVTERSNNSKKFVFADENGTDHFPDIDMSELEDMCAEGPTPPPFVIEINGEEMNDIAISTVDMSGAMGSKETPAYTVTVPRNATSAKLYLEEELQYTYYNSVGAYLGQDAGSWTASDELTVAIQDKYSNPSGANAIEEPDGELDGVSLQDPDLYMPKFLVLFVYAEGDEEVYTITVEQPAAGGTISANKITATEGEEVFVSYVAAAGYCFKHFLINDEPAYLENGVLMMPAENVTISAAFEKDAPTTYAVNINAAENGTVTADKDTAAAGEKVALTVAPATGYELNTLIVKQGDDEIEVVNNEFTMPAGAVTVSATFKKVVAGYRFATSADVSAENGGTAVVHVKITGHSDPNVKNYNAYDLTLTFDSEKLELATDDNNDYIYSGAVKSDNGSVTVEGNTIRIVGCGTGKPFDTEIAELTFKTKGEGQANVTIDKVQVSDKETAVDDNVPEATPKHVEEDTSADETPDVSVIVVPYTVSKPGFISGENKVLHGETYTFSYTDTTNYTYADLTVKVGGTAVETLIPDENGVYTIANVTGAVEITATQTANSYDVIFNEENTAKVEGSNKATYGENYIFTVTPSTEDMAIESVTITDAQGNEIKYTINENGEYVIKGTDITGKFTITVTEANTKTSITFTGIEESEIEGGLTQTAKIGKKFTFKLNKVAGFDYTVKVGDTVLEEKDGEYTIPADLVVAGGVQVDITKEDNTKPVVDVTEYINLNGKTMFLVTAKWRDRVLAYGEEGTMYWSNKYTVTGETEAGAYCWLVVSTGEMNTVELVKAAAEAAIVEAAEGTTATSVKYNYDINGTTKVDVNDAQLAYDMYNAAYMKFTDTLPMWKFLEADMETDGKLNTKDVAAIISYIVSGANA